MIVDTSALAAISLGERKWEELRRALLAEEATLPAPVLLELQLALARRSAVAMRKGQTLVEELITLGVEVAALTKSHSDLANEARERYGKGNERGGLLNFGDLMVYAIAKERGEPLLCTGRDFASTDLEIHPASRIDR